MVIVFDPRLAVITPCPRSPQCACLARIGVPAKPLGAGVDSRQGGVAVQAHLTCSAWQAGCICWRPSLAWFCCDNQGSMALEEAVDVGQSGHSRGVVQVKSWHSEMTHLHSVLSDRVQA